MGHGFTISLKNVGCMSRASFVSPTTISGGGNCHSHRSRPHHRTWRTRAWGGRPCHGRGADARSYVRRFVGGAGSVLSRRTRIGDAARVRRSHVSVPRSCWGRLFAGRIRAANVRSSTRSCRRSHAWPNRLAARRCGRDYGMSHFRDLDVFARHSRPKE